MRAFKRTVLVARRSHGARDLPQGNLKAAHYLTADSWVRGSAGKSRSWHESPQVQIPLGPLPHEVTAELKGGPRLSTNGPPSFPIRWACRRPPPRPLLWLRVLMVATFARRLGPPADARSPRAHRSP